MELQKLIDYCAEQLDKKVIDGSECPDLDECQIEIQVFERLKKYCEKRGKANVIHEAERFVYVHCYKM